MEQRRTFEHRVKLKASGVSCFQLGYKTRGASGVQTVPVQALVDPDTLRRNPEPDGKSGQQPAL